MHAEHEGTHLLGLPFSLWKEGRLMEKKHACYRYMALK
jgi:hypothetical protein